MNTVVHAWKVVAFLILGLVVPMKALGANKGIYTIHPNGQLHYFECLPDGRIADTAKVVASGGWKGLDKAF